MAWQTSAIPMLRVIINDLDTPYTYADARLTQVLLVAAIYIIREIDFDTTYTIDIVAETITPDPSTDAAFMAFMVMKAACQTDFSTYRTKALLDGVSAKCGPVSLTVGNHLKGFKDLLELGPCAAYDTMRKDYMFGGGNLCKAILSPFIGNNFDPTYLNNNINYDNREHYT